MRPAWPREGNRAWHRWNPPPDTGNATCLSPGRTFRPCASCHWWASGGGVSTALLPARAGLAMGVAAPNPFLLRFLKTCAARTLLLAIVTFATLLFSGCAYGDFIYTSALQQGTFGLGGVPPNRAFVD